MADAKEIMEQDLKIVPPLDIRLTPAEKKMLMERGIIDSDGKHTDYGKDLLARKKLAEKVENNPNAPVPVDSETEARVAQLLADDEITGELPDYVPGEVTEAEATPAVTIPNPDVDNPTVDRTCPNCGWDTRFKPEEELTEEDKRNFLRHLLGGAKTRFMKTYEFFDGMLKVTFHSRIVEETEQTYIQANSDVRKDLLHNEVEFGLTMTQYQMALSLDKIVHGSEVHTFEPMTADRFKCTNSEYMDGITPVKKMHDAYIKQMNEGLFNILLSAFKKFEYTYVHLQAKALKPDFWTETSGQRSQ